MKIDIPRLTDSDLPAALDVDEVAKIIDVPADQWHQRCHGISLAIVRAGLIPHARVARGVCDGVPGQHSWIVGAQRDAQGNEVLGDCYADNAPIIDPTLWTYRDDVTGIFTGYANEGPGARWHQPHGKGPHIMEVGRPPYPARGERVIPLAPAALAALSDDARWWVEDMFGPLSRTGWNELAHMTVVGWASDEIVAAMARTPGLAHLVPIDKVGMLTALNPGGLYLHADDVDPAATEVDAELAAAED